MSRSRDSHIPLDNSAAHSGHPALAELLRHIEKDTTLCTDDAATTDELIELYRQTLRLAEKLFWDDIDDSALLEHIQRCYRELEELHESPSRHDFLIAIPVADRPLQVKQCLRSLLKLCDIYNYGKTHPNGVYDKVSVLLIDDSRQAESVSLHRQHAQYFTQHGLRTEYFGAAEQVTLLRDTHITDNEALQSALGDYASIADTVDIDDEFDLLNAFSHKGASISRNIAYLHLDRSATVSDNTLIYFIDSDQEFCVTVAHEGGYKDLYAVNYLYHLDEIFRTTNTRMLTGKVVGDPPVSPAVMANKLTGDIIDFLEQLSHQTPDSSCLFHVKPDAHSNDAIYHDMARLFGFGSEHDHVAYNCTLKSSHDHTACMLDFSEKLNRFFYGEHPTRITSFQYSDDFAHTTPARTVYTGNYVFSKSCLSDFIPFANLKLRMAGPVMGRLLRSSLGDDFVSANLPMLHKRTLSESGESEFRSDVLQDDASIDLSGEFERQYFGDVMLFGIEKLFTTGFPDKRISRQRIMQILSDVESEMHEHYRQKQRETLLRLQTLQDKLDDSTAWWNSDSVDNDAVGLIQRFIDNITCNYSSDSNSHRLINDASNVRSRLDSMARAILDYDDSLKQWRRIMG